MIDHPIPRFVHNNERHQPIAQSLPWNATAIVITLKTDMSAPDKPSINLFDHLEVQTAFQQFGENQSGCFMVKDREHRFQFVNQHFADMTGQKPEDLVGRSDVELGFPALLLFGDPYAGLPGVHVRDEECMASGKPMRTIDGTVDLGGEQFDSTLTIRTPLTNDKGDVVGLIIQALDQSDVRHLEKEIESANETATDLDGKLSTLDRLLAELLVCHDRQTLLQKITDTIVSQTLAHGAQIATPNESGEYLELIASSGSNEGNLLGATYGLNEGLIGQVWKSRELLFTDDAVASGANYQYTKKTQACVLPIMDGNRIGAVLSAVLLGEDNPKFVDDITTLARIRNLAGIALSNASLIATTRAALQQTRTLVDVSRQLATVEDVDTTCMLVCDALAHALDVCETGIVLLDEYGGIAASTVKRADRLTKIEFVDGLPILELVARRCIDAGKIITLDNAEKNTTTADNVMVIPRRASDNEGHALALPLIKNGKIKGALCVMRASDQAPLDHGMLDTLTTVTSQLGTTLERQDLTQALHHQAFHDRLTGLPNRHQFESTLQDLLDEGETGAILFIDLDGFKDVNDSLGHGVGDQLLHLVASRLLTRLKPEDVLARMGGDEFAVILRSSNGNDDAVEGGERLLDTLTNCFLIEKSRINISASVGLSRFPEDGNSVDLLLRNADVAMYQAKNTGKARLLSFDEGIAEEFRQRSLMQADLVVALEEDQFELHYQPQVSCGDGTVVGVEALMRWIHPEKGAISPVDFIPAAEHAGLINDIGTWVLEKAIQQLAQWQNTNPLGDLRMSINIAATQFQLDGFTDLVFSTLARHSVPANRLELEVTESVVMNDVAAVIRRLKALREAGVRIAVDDFGTGYSSLSYLQDLPLDVLKIDRAFVSRLQEEPADQSLANTIALLAIGLGLEIVAEGVETTKQRDAIVAMGCEMIQGFFYSSAVPASELLAVVERLNTELPLDKVA